MARISMIVWNEFRNDARVLKEAETLQAAGHAVTVFALHTPGVTEKTQTIGSGIRIVRVTRSPFWRLRRPARIRNAERSREPTQTSSKAIGATGLFLRAILRSWTHAELLMRMVSSRPDVVHAHDVNTLPTAWLASTLARAPLVYDAHEISTDREGYAALRNLVGWIEKRLMPRAAATITTTDARAKFFARAYRIPRPLVLQNRPRVATTERSDRIRQELQLPKPWPIVLYQGGLQQGRGLEKLVEAAAGVGRAYFVFIGGGRLEQKLQAQAHALHLEERVRFIPTVELNELLAYTASADIGVQPIENTCLNHFTTDSNKLFEYVMAGLPVVASDLPEIRKVVNGNDLGLLVEPGNIDALTEALGRMVADESLRCHHGKKARAAAAALNWEAQEHQLVAMYDRIFS